MNKNKLITIIFPSRSRINLVKKLLLSIEEKTYNKEWIEVISICDHDDKETISLFQEISSQITYDFKFVSRKQKEKLDLPNDYYDIGLKLASDSYFTWILGNDCEITTDNWDQLFYDAINNSLPYIFSDVEKNTKFYYFKISDDTHWNKNIKLLDSEVDNSCCFPILSSNYCKTLGEFYPKEIPTWGGDTALYDLCDKSNITNIINASDIIEIKHYCHHNNRVEQDVISKKIENQHDKNYYSVIVNKIFKSREKFLWN